MYHAARGLDEASHLRELIHGLPQLERTEAMMRDFDDRNEELVARIEAIRDFLLNRARLTVSFTGTDAGHATVREAVDRWARKMRDEPVANADTGFVPYDAPPREGLAGPVQVAYCAAVCPAPHYSADDETLLSVGAHIVSLDYFMSELRFQGNAYGAWFRYSGKGRSLTMGSYRDPHVARTLGVFENTADWVAKADWSDEDIRRAIIATAKNEERPIRPAQATTDALYRHLDGLTPQRREQRFARLKAATAPAVRRALLEMLHAGRARTAVCVVTNRQKLEHANTQMPGRELAIRDILS
jgi:hypothetical protein